MFALLYNAILLYMNVITLSGQCMTKGYFMVVYVYIQYREMHRNTPHSNTSEHTRRLFIQLVYKSLYCLVDVILPFAVSDPDVPTPPPPPTPYFFFFFFCSTQPLRSYNHQHESESVTAHFSQAYPSCVVSSCFCFHL